ncbi:hypothetical protein H5410_046401 [Solanum commersonii]|uniref:Uncharacterized protein n=1 Tax=Solanum commersonii TaxID=4109 RepID=A0A9J5XEB8_SOLCO|nr:hypothetical protein H5410_046401 [Solanum commersonii]
MGKRSISWPAKVDDDEVVTSRCSMEKNNEEAKLTRIEREQTYLLYRGGKGDPWERINNSKFFFLKKQRESFFSWKGKK